MRKMMEYSLGAAGGSTATLVVLNVPFFDALLIASAATILTGVIIAASQFMADQTYRPGVNAGKMMKGVCPECGVFNSLQEVTSADPSRRRVDCRACEESFEVQMTDRGITARRLGKYDDAD
jgi:hypothetical protein